MVTRYTVALDRGGELQVVRQNLETSSAQAQELRGRRVRVAWHEQQAAAIDGERTLEEGA
jgi:putative spermidine/putrescine transport system ATP-binding protein